MNTRQQDCIQLLFNFYLINTNNLQFCNIRPGSPILWPRCRRAIIFFLALRQHSLEPHEKSQNEKDESTIRQENLFDFGPVLVSSRFAHVPRPFTVHSPSVGLGMANVSTVGQCWAMDQNSYVRRREYSIRSRSGQDFRTR
jgi:hypothetical protein